MVSYRNLNMIRRALQTNPPKDLIIQGPRSIQTEKYWGPICAIYMMKDISHRILRINDNVLLSSASRKSLRY